VDALECVVTLRIRTAIVHLGTACEIASNLYLSRHNKEADPDVKKILRRRISFAEKHFHRLTNLISHKSLRTEDPEIFATIEEMYKLRNIIVHQGGYSGAETSSIKTEQAMRFYDAANTAIIWIDNL